MKLQKIIFVITVALFTLTSCKSEKKEVKNTATLSVNQQDVKLKISGMTCEIGCAKTIQSKLAKKEGVLNATVVFKDSIANIQYDANKLSKNELVAFVNGIGGGDLYKANVCEKKSCKTTDKKSWQ